MFRVKSGLNSPFPSQSVSPQSDLAVSTRGSSPGPTDPGPDPVSRLPGGTSTSPVPPPRFRPRSQSRSGGVFEGRGPTRPTPPSTSSHPSYTPTPVDFVSDCQQRGGRGGRKRERGGCRRGRASARGSVPWLPDKGGKAPSCINSSV